MEKLEQVAATFGGYDADSSPDLDAPDIQVLLYDLSALTSLSIELVQNGISRPYGVALAQGVASSSTLVSLTLGTQGSGSFDLSGTAIRQLAASCLSDASGSSALEALRLSGSFSFDWDADVLVVLASLLGSKSRLRILELSRGSSGISGGFASLVAGLETNTTLEELSLKGWLCGRSGPLREFGIHS